MYELVDEFNDTESVFGMDQCEYCGYWMLPTNQPTKVYGRDWKYESQWHDPDCEYIRLKGRL